jgi:sulfonate transport system substrate-binding protein
MSPSIRRLWRPVLLAIATAAAVAACGSSSTTTSAKSLASGSSTSASGIPAGTVLNFGDQQQTFQTMLKASGALNGVPYQVNFVEFNSGPLVNAGFSARRIDLGFMGDLPATLAVQAGIPVKAVATALPIGASQYLLAKPGITSISQLKGKQVAYTTGTAEQAFALRALATAGLTQNDVHQVNVSLLQLGTVLESGSTDASVVSIEQKTAYEQNHPGSTVLATIDKTKPESYLYVLGTMAALNEPGKKAAIDDFTRRLIAATTWEKTHQADWVNAYFVNVEHQTPAAAKLILAAGGTYNFVPITATVQSALQNVVNLLAGAGAIPASYSIDPLFDPSESQRYNNILKGVSQNG